MQILRVRFRDRVEFEDHYQEDFTGGGVFCPTTTPMTAGTNVIVEIGMTALPNKLLIRSQVCSWRAAIPRLRVRAGAFVEFDKEEAEKVTFLLGSIRGDIVAPRKRKHTRLPVALAVQYRSAASPDYIDASLDEISVGGALLKSAENLTLDTDIILLITPPGSASPVSIAAKAAYHLPSGATGLKFPTRDSAGSRRLRELVRRLREGV